MIRSDATQIQSLASHPRAERCTISTDWFDLFE